MSLSVKQLIAKLRKQNPDAIVVWRDHDQTIDEYNSKVGSVEEGGEEVCKHAEEAAVVVLSW